MKDPKQLKRKIKFLIILFMAGLILSGLTAFPLETELGILNSTAIAHLSPDNPVYVWINSIYKALQETNRNYPYLAYGTDWLAFAHLVIAAAFIGPLRDPVRNIWVIEFGMVACLMVFPLALIMGPVRDIPMFWRIIDCSFGVVGILPLLLCRRYIHQLSQSKA
ncbi:MAG: hypothetical protein ACJ75J_14100 [Cytophagaceae bacterium]